MLETLYTHHTRRHKTTATVHESSKQQYQWNCFFQMRPSHRIIKSAIRNWCGLIGVLAFSWAAQAQTSDAPQMNLPRIEMSAGLHRIQAQVAQSPVERQIGLMHRTDMPEQEGMLFVFEEAGVQCFWMKNTRLPLTAAFVDDDGTIVNMADMMPMTENAHCSNKPVRFVLEMNQGWFSKRRISPGMKLIGAPFRKPSPVTNKLTTPTQKAPNK